MATTERSDTATPGTRRKVEPRRRLWTKAEYYRLDELGFFRDQRVELLGGEIFLMTIKPPHCASVVLTGDALRAAFGPGFCVRSQGTLDLGVRSQPQPDLAVVPGSPRDYARHHPTTALLVVEISETTLRYDRMRKSPRYARAGIGEYWIVNLVDRQLEIYRNPERDPARPSQYVYTKETIVPADGQVTPLAKPDAVIAVADLLP